MLDGDRITREDLYDWPKIVSEQFSAASNATSAATVNQDVTSLRRSNDGGGRHPAEARGSSHDRKPNTLKIKVE